MFQLKYFHISVNKKNVFFDSMISKKYVLIIVYSIHYITCSKNNFNFIKKKWFYNFSVLFTYETNNNE